MNNAEITPENLRELAKEDIAKHTEGPSKHHQWRDENTNGACHCGKMADDPIHMLSVNPVTA